MIIYRDFKPENIMVDETVSLIHNICNYYQGYIKLIDLGIAKKLGPDTNYRTHSFIGKNYKL